MGHMTQSFLCIFRAKKRLWEDIFPFKIISQQNDSVHYPPFKKHILGLNRAVSQWANIYKYQVDIIEAIHVSDFVKDGLY